MPKIKIVKKRIIIVPYDGENGKFAAKKSLWEYLRDNHFTAQNIHYRYNEIVAEVIAGTEEKELKF